MVRRLLEQSVAADERVGGLGQPESPRIGEILGEIRKRKLNGELDGREAELAAARELVAESVPA